MDVTNHFRATVKSIHSRNKAISCEDKKDLKAALFNATKSRGAFESVAKDVIRTITKLREFLLEHRKDYVNAGSHLSGEGSRMSDTEREQIDTEAQNIIKKCQESLGNVKKQAEAEKVHPQVKEHREAVLNLVHAYLKVVCKIYSEQKAVRVKRVVDRKRIMRIHPDRSLHRSMSKSSEEPGDMSTNAQPSSSTPKSDSPKASPMRAARISESKDYMDSDDEISKEEAQMFEQENRAIFEEMHSLSTQVSSIQGKVVEIAALQEVFTDKVLQQGEDIIRIADTAVHTTENVKDANEEIREAMKKNAGFRVWILFFLLVLTFSLLFLDWYSS